jgi:4-hydroxy-tetrahydrodipicolinate synthase
MSAAPQISGVYCAAATPIGPDLAVDLELFTAHCRQLLANGCDGVALLGTTGEANSFSVAERRAVLEGVVAGGIAPDQLMPGTGCCAIPDTVDLTRDALSLGITRVVMLPPFYYKGASEEGLFGAYSEVIEQVADTRLRIVLYHIPQMSGVPVTLGLMRRLVARYPATVVGVKDSAGDLANMKAIVDALPGFSVLAGADPLMLALLQYGGAGCITATSNLISDSLATVFRHFRDPAQAATVEAAQARINQWRTLSNAFGAQIATIKAMLAVRTGAEGWQGVRPPLTALSEAQRSELSARLAPLLREAA